jgi:hypothetical protein
MFYDPATQTKHKFGLVFSDGRFIAITNCDKCGRECDIELPEDKEYDEIEHLCDECRQGITW